MESEQTTTPPETNVNFKPGQRVIITGPHNRPIEGVFQGVTKDGTALIEIDEGMIATVKLDQIRKASVLHIPRWLRRIKF